MFSWQRFTSRSSSVQIQCYQGHRVSAGVFNQATLLALKSDLDIAFFFLFHHSHHSADEDIQQQSHFLSLCLWKHKFLTFSNWKSWNTFPPQDTPENSCRNSSDKALWLRLLHPRVLQLLREPRAIIISAYSYFIDLIIDLIAFWFC